MAGNNSLELEINSLFQEGNTLETICAEIIAKYEKSDVISPSEAESISHFLITAGRPDLLFKFYLKCLYKESMGDFPWGSFKEAYDQFEPSLPTPLLDIIETALDDKKNYENASKSPSLVNLIPSISAYLDSRRQQFDSERLSTKTKLISQLNHNRLYQLREQEEQTLQQLIRMFPLDTEVKLLHQAHLEKKADEILSRVRTPRSNKYSRHLVEKHSPETEDFISQIKQHISTLSDKLQTESPEQLYNLTILALQFELYDLSLELIDKAPKSFASEWLKAEILFESSRFLDLLKHLENIESDMTSTPESTYGAIYLRAQAYYGLGQKEIAIQLLESLSAKVPSYRSTEALIHEWRNS